MPAVHPDSLSEVSETVDAFSFRPNVAPGSWTEDGMKYHDRLFC
jgi:hypothetical protein